MSKPLGKTAKRKIGSDILAVIKRREAFIRALAEYLVGDQAKKSIELEMGKEHALQWAKLRAATPLHGYPTVDEAKAILTDFLA